MIQKYIKLLLLVVVLSLFIHTCKLNNTIIEGNTETYHDKTNNDFVSINNETLNTYGDQDHPPTKKYYPGGHCMGQNNIPLNEGDQCESYPGVYGTCEILEENQLVCNVPSSSSSDTIDDSIAGQIEVTHADRDLINEYVIRPIGNPNITHSPYCYNTSIDYDPDQTTIPTCTGLNGIYNDICSDALANGENCEDTIYREDNCIYDDDNNICKNPDGEEDTNCSEQSCENVVSSNPVQCVYDGTTCNAPEGEEDDQRCSLVINDIMNTCEIEVTSNSMCRLDELGICSDGYGGPCENVCETTLSEERQCESGEEPLPSNVIPGCPTSNEDCFDVGTTTIIQGLEDCCLCNDQNWLSQIYTSKPDDSLSGQTSITIPDGFFTGIEFPPPDYDIYKLDDTNQGHITENIGPSTRRFFNISETSLDTLQGIDLDNEPKYSPKTGYFLDDQSEIIYPSNAYPGYIDSGENSQLGVSGYYEECLYRQVDGECRCPINHEPKPDPTDPSNPENTENPECQPCGPGLASVDGLRCVSCNDMNKKSDAVSDSDECQGLEDQGTCESNNSCLWDNACLSLSNCVPCYSDNNLNKIYREGVDGVGECKEVGSQIVRSDCEPKPSSSGISCHPEHIYSSPVHSELDDFYDTCLSTPDCEVIQSIISEEGFTNYPDENGNTPSSEGRTDMGNIGNMFTNELCKSLSYDNSGTTCNKFEQCSYNTTLSQCLLNLTVDDDCQSLDQSECGNNDQCLWNGQTNKCYLGDICGPDTYTFIPMPTHNKDGSYINNLSLTDEEGNNCGQTSDQIKHCEPTNQDEGINTDPYCLNGSGFGDHVTGQDFMDKTNCNYTFGHSDNYISGYVGESIGFCLSDDDEITPTGCLPSNTINDLLLPKNIDGGLEDYTLSRRCQELCEANPDLCEGGTNYAVKYPTDLNSEYDDEGCYLIKNSFNDCQNDSICNEDVDADTYPLGYKCDCINGWTGTDCDDCASGFTDDGNCDQCEEHRYPKISPDIDNTAAADDVCLGYDDITTCNENQDNNNCFWNPLAPLADGGVGDCRTYCQSPSCNAYNCHGTDDGTDDATCEPYGILSCGCGNKRSGTNCNTCMPGTYHNVKITSDVTYCSDISENDICDSTEICTWDPPGSSGQCVSTCSQLDSSNCGDNEYCELDSGQCVNNCSLLLESTDCIQNTGCVWDDETCKINSCEINQYFCNEHGIAGGAGVAFRGSYDADPYTDTFTDAVNYNPEGDIEYCTDCGDGYHLNDTTTFTCDINECTCIDSNGGTIGVPATGSECTVHNNNICTDCGDGYHLNDTTHTCDINECTCMDTDETTIGVPATGSECTEWIPPLNNICTHCGDGYHLNESTCDINECTCIDSNGDIIGVPATGSECTVHNSNICASCNDGYHSVDNDCIVNVIECEHGVPFVSSGEVDVTSGNSPEFTHCMTDSCDNGYLGTNCQYSNEETCNGNGTVDDDGGCACHTLSDYGDIDENIITFVRNAGENIGGDYPLYDGPDCSECNRFFTKSDDGVCNIGPEVCNYKGFPINWTGPDRDNGNGMCNCIQLLDGGSLSPRYSYSGELGYKGGPEGSGHPVSDINTCSSMCELETGTGYSNSSCSNNSDVGGFLWEVESGHDPQTSCDARQFPQSTGSEFKCQWVTEDDLELPNMYIL